MTKKMRLFAGAGLVICSVVFSACSLGESNTSEVAQEEQERPGVVLTGKLVQAAGKYFLQTNGKDTEITSRRIDLMPFVGKNVEIHGEFSGTTLYLDSIK